MVATVIQAPLHIEIKTVPASGLNAWMYPWERCSWESFAAANADSPEEVNRVAADIVVRGSTCLGGGAAPLTFIRRG